MVYLCTSLILRAGFAVTASVLLLAGSLFTEVAKQLELRSVRQFEYALGEQTVAAVTQEQADRNIAVAALDQAEADELEADAAALEGGAAADEADAAAQSEAAETNPEETATAEAGGSAEGVEATAEVAAEVQDLAADIASGISIAGESTAASIEAAGAAASVATAAEVAVEGAAVGAAGAAGAGASTAVALSAAALTIATEGPLVAKAAKDQWAAASAEIQAASDESLAVEKEAEAGGLEASVPVYEESSVLAEDAAIGSAVAGAAYLATSQVLLLCALGLQAPVAAVLLVHKGLNTGLGALGVASAAVGSIAYVGTHGVRHPASFSSLSAVAAHGSLALGVTAALAGSWAGTVITAARLETGTGALTSLQKLPGLAQQSLPLLQRREHPANHSAAQRPYLRKSKQWQKPATRSTSLSPSTLRPTTEKPEVKETNPTTAAAEVRSPTIPKAQELAEGPTTGQLQNLFWSVDDQPRGLLDSSFLDQAGGLLDSAEASAKEALRAGQEAADDLAYRAGTAADSLAVRTGKAAQQTEAALQRAVHKEAPKVQSALDTAAGKANKVAEQIPGLLSEGGKEASKLAKSTAEKTRASAMKTLKDWYVRPPKTATTSVAPITPSPSPAGSSLWQTLQPGVSVVLSTLWRWCSTIVMDLALLSLVFAAFALILSYGRQRPSLSCGCTDPLSVAGRVLSDVWSGWAVPASLLAAVWVLSILLATALERHAERVQDLLPGSLVQSVLGVVGFLACLGHAVLLSRLECSCGKGTCTRGRFGHMSPTPAEEERPLMMASEESTKVMCLDSSECFEPVTMPQLEEPCEPCQVNQSAPDRPQDQGPDVVVVVQESAPESGPKVEGLVLVEGSSSSTSSSCCRSCFRRTASMVAGAALGLMGVVVAALEAPVFAWSFGSAVKSVGVIGWLLYELPWDVTSPEVLGHKLSPHLLLLGLGAGALLLGSLLFVLQRWAESQTEREDEGSSSLTHRAAL